MIEQLKNTPAREWIRALDHDGFSARKSKGSHHVYQHADGRRVLIVYHKLSDTFGPKTIKQLLVGTRWNKIDLERLRLVR
ncbi:MAG: hypothetical protein A3H27_02155 [Acidobacteria bacterium RIFCSPLOWO2_02_FULL_59_13]|nr:MAG: hypothetical protein A3H27_02155 [Acidobacteria bacterium RIFCSPLOWO2_02_FULL_59_13]